MNKILIAGSLVVTVALIFYTLAFINELRGHVLTRKLLTLFLVGLFFDIAATSLMITGSPNSPFTLHGFIGYSALTAMVIDVILLWRYYKRFGENSSIPSGIHRYTVFAYLWWVLAFITGGMIAAMN